MARQKLHVIVWIIGLMLVTFWGGAAANAQGTLDDEKLMRGARLYAENCAVCHVSQGEGRVGVTLAKAWPSIRPDLSIKTTIQKT